MATSRTSSPRAGPPPLLRAPPPPAPRATRPGLHWPRPAAPAWAAGAGARGGRRPPAAARRGSACTAEAPGPGELPTQQRRRPCFDTLTLEAAWTYLRRQVGLGSLWQQAGDARRPGGLAASVGVMANFVAVLQGPVEWICVPGTAKKAFPASRSVLCPAAGPPWHHAPPGSPSH